MKQIPKIYRDIFIAGMAGIIFISSFGVVYSHKLHSDLKEIKSHIENADFKYACFESFYNNQMRKQKSQNNKINIFLLQNLKPVTSDGIFVYFSRWATTGRAEKRYSTSRKLAQDLLATEPPFCLILKD
jgi:uncharacterized UPF0160 family protein